MISELNLIYDMSPEQTFLKLFIRSSQSIDLMNQESTRKIYLDLLCNEFEYEILYRRAFSSMED